jgi:mannose-6-phosphate isomerase-like protein (cupin superfamily)
MAGYTKLNLRDDVEDQAPNFGLGDNLEARMARVPLELEHSGVSYQRLAPNYRLPFGHTHKTQEEVYVVIAGGGRAKVGDEIVELGHLDALRVHKGTPRSFEAGPEGLELLAIGAPNTGPGDADVLQGWWQD